MAIPKITFICEQCGDSFELAAWVVKQGQTGRWCSRQCAGIAKRERVDRICEYCKGEFQATKSAVEKGQARFCSQECYHTSTQQKISCVCENCNKPFETVPSKSERRFCSHECSGEFFRIPLPERFAKYIGPTTEKGCVLWIGTLDDNGYGVIWSGPPENTRLRAHRVSFELAGNILPDDLEVLHRCDNPPYICPEHLFSGTHSDNMKDCKVKGRTAKGEANGLTTLTEAQAMAIKQRYIPRVPGLRASLAEEYNTSQGTIYRIGMGITWKHLNSTE